MLALKLVVRCHGSVVRCSKYRGEVQWICGEEQGSVVQQILCKDCGEVVNNWLINLRRAVTHTQLQAI